MDMANLNFPGTLAFAVRHAMDNLGAKKVATIVGCSASTLYKATSVPPGRSMPAVTFDQALAIVEALKNQRRRSRRSRKPDRVEHFSTVFRYAGRTRTVHSLDLHHVMTHATADVGAFARLICESTDQPSPGASIGLDDLSRIAQLGRQAMSSIAQVIEVAEHSVKIARGEESVLIEEADYSAATPDPSVGAAAE